MHCQRETVTPNISENSDTLTLITDPKRHTLLNFSKRHTNLITNLRNHSERNTARETNLA